MQIVKITGAQGAGKFEALSHLAELYQSTVITGALAITLEVTTTGNFE
jgi:dephospho-CoA kinase